MHTPFRVAIVLTAALVVSAAGRKTQSPQVSLLRVPDGGIQPQVARDSRGVVHMVYYRGDPKGGDLFYVRSSDEGATFTAPLRVNSQEGSAVAAGTIRGGQLAVGGDGRVHVAWNGSMKALPRVESPMHHGTSPMLYARLNERGSAFEEQRNLMRDTFGLDGGGSLAADGAGGVFVSWHGWKRGSPHGEDARQVWLVRSTDHGASFSTETAASTEPTGACGCCGMRLFADSKGRLYILYRSAAGQVNRDIYLLVSQDHGKSFRGRKIHPWIIKTCPMSSMAFAEDASGVIAAWETEKQVYYARIDSRDLEVSEPVSAPGDGGTRKHPALARNARGETLLAWTSGGAWGKGGNLEWTLFDRKGAPVTASPQPIPLPAWSFAATLTRPDGSFAIFF